MSADKNEQLQRELRESLHTKLRLEETEENQQSIDPEIALLQSSIRLLVDVIPQEKDESLRREMLNALQQKTEDFARQFGVDYNPLAITAVSEAVSDRQAGLKQLAE